MLPNNYKSIVSFIAPEHVQVLAKCTVVIVETEYGNYHHVNCCLVSFSAYFLQCFDAVGWAAGRASGL